MNTHSDSPTSAPRPECDVIASQLPLLHTGTLTLDITTAIEVHMRTCLSCRSQRADLDHVETVLRRIYSAGAAPFQPITIDEIQGRIEQQPHVGVAQYPGNSMSLLTSQQPEHLQSARSKSSQEHSGGQRMPAWVPRLTTVAAVITLVSLFAMLFQTVAPSGSGTWVPTSTVSPATATPIHYLGARPMGADGTDTGRSANALYDLHRLAGRSACHVSLPAHR